jgi:hypothetical protein
MEESLEYWKNLFGYTGHWFVFGFLDDEFVRQQADTWRSAEDRDVSHYKWAAYRKVLSHFDFSDREVFRAFVRVMEADPDEHLYKGAVADLLDHHGVPAHWFEEFQDSRILAQPTIQARLQSPR